MAEFRVALAGDVILNTRVSARDDGPLIEALGILRESELAYAHMEIPLHDFDADDIFPAAEGALSWMSGPTSVAKELRWCGIDIVSVASNHSFDYSYGGLRSTLEVLRAAGIPHAGAGEDLAAARRPAFLDSPHGRVALVSAVSSFPTFARAGAARTDLRGRPGVNGLRYYYRVDRLTADAVRSVFKKMGYWVTHNGDEFVVNPPGLHNTIQRFRVTSADSQFDTCCDEDDLAGNMASIRYARSVADCVLVHLHSHEWEAADGRMRTSPAFVEQYARSAVDAGASMVVVQGSHAPFRGIEIFRSTPIFYDPGPLFRLGRRDRQPQDFYVRWGNSTVARSGDAGILEAFQDRVGALGDGEEGRHVEAPSEGVSHSPGFFVPVCAVDTETQRVRDITLHPMTWMRGSKGVTGFPIRASDETAQAVLELVQALSKPYGTVVQIEDGLGRITSL